MAWLDSAAWTGQISSDGWHEALGGSRDVVEPATGSTLGSIGLASAADVEQAAAIAAKAQPGWAATPFQERAAILRRAGELVEANREEIRWCDEAQIPFGGVGASGTGSRFGGADANIEAFTETQWVTVRSEVPPHPF
ncbi:MAG TPA: aldehyde dehydrogenase family protein [Mycobacteriales bacterium]|nr:aldehyde dehydrogenase family protein [Mycobacteriales bacterium]